MLGAALGTAALPRPAGDTLDAAVIEVALAAQDALVAAAGDAQSSATPALAPPEADATVTLPALDGPTLALVADMRSMAQHVLSFHWLLLSCQRDTAFAAQAVAGFESLRSSSQPMQQS
jgi:hypothetical protein